MASGLFSKIIKGILIGGGSILSVIPGLMPFGAASIAAGLAIKAPGTIDPISSSASTIAAYIGGGTSSGSTTGNTIFDWIKANFLYVLLVIGGLILLLTGKRSRR